LFRLKTLLEKHKQELAEIITTECGKTRVESLGEIDRAIENVEMACGNFNGVGPAKRMSMAQILYGIWAATGSSVDFIWVTEDFLEDQGVQPWSDLPSWIPGDPLMYCANQKSIEAGLSFRPLAVTAVDTLQWDRTRPDKERLNRKAGISRELEKEILTVWRKRNG